jgi:hypothetical protein
MLQKFFEFKQEDLDPIKSFYIKDELNPKVWNNGKINQDVREDLLKIAQDFWSDLELEAEVKDIILTGSLANYNWHQKYSDYDLHIVIDFADVDENVELVSKYLDEVKKNWNRQHDIKIEGFEVEVYVQDWKEPHASSGVYSLLNDKWNVKPTKKNFKPDEKTIGDKAKNVMLMVDDLEENIDEMPYDEFNTLLKKVWKKVKDFRKKGLEDGDEFSIGNLVFKTLRRNNYISKIMELKRKSYDQQFK